MSTQRTARRAAFRHAVGWVAAAGLGYAVLGPIYTAYVPLLLADLGAPAVVIGIVTNLDGLLLMLAGRRLGAWSDRTWTRAGRRRPFLLAGLAVLVATFPWLPIISGPALPVLLIGTAAALVLLRVPRIAWLGDLFPATLRGRANAWINLGVGLGAPLAFIGGAWLYERWPAAPFWAATSLAVLLIGGACLAIQEPPPTPAILQAETQRTSRLPWLLLTAAGLLAGTSQMTVAFFTLYGHERLHLEPGTASTLLGIFGLGGLVFALPGGWLGSKVGAARATMSSLAAMAFLFAAAAAVTNPMLLAALLFVAAGAFSTVQINLPPLLLAQERGSKAGGSLGAYASAQAAGSLAAPVLFGAWLDATHLWFTLFLAGAIFCLIGAICCALQTRLFSRQ